MKKEKKYHPSQGTIAFRRRHGGKTNLFGSHILHENTIALTVYHASLQRNLNEDQIVGEKKIIEVEMSESQFAQAITSMNIGTGVPVTIRYTETDGSIPPCKFVNKHEEFTSEFVKKRKEVVHDVKEILREVETLFQEKKTLNKADKALIIHKLRTVDANIGTDLDLVVEQFDRHMDQTVHEAKCEIEAFMKNKIQDVANEYIAEEIKKRQKEIAKQKSE